MVCTCGRGVVSKSAVVAAARLGGHGGQGGPAGPGAAGGAGAQGGPGGLGGLGGEDDHEIFLWQAAGAGKRRASNGGGSVGGGVGEEGRDKEDPTFNRPFQSL